MCVLVSLAREVVCWFLGSVRVGEFGLCVGSRVHLVGISISFEKNFYRLSFTPPSLVRHLSPSSGIKAGYDT
jgi:hypothetical protein